MIFLKSILKGLASLLWSSVNALVRMARQAGWIRPVALGARVISVGNIQAGGSGKTPLVAQIAREGHARGLRVAILCRGYGGSWESGGGVIPPLEQAGRLGPVIPAPDPAQCGDEAALLHELAPAAWIGVGADRIASFKRIQERAGLPQLVVIDDGFQNWRIQKSIEVVAVTSAGRADIIHRDFLGALDRAQLVVWTKGETAPFLEGMPGSPRTPRVDVHFELPIATLRSPIWLVSGVGDPASLEKSVKAAGYQLDKHLVFRDHASYERAQAQAILKDARAARARVALTGKDWVKWRALGIAAGEVIVLEPALRFRGGRKNWDRVLWGS